MSKPEPRHGIPRNRFMTAVSLVTPEDSADAPGIVFAHLCDACPHVHLVVATLGMQINVILNDEQTEKLRAMLAAPEVIHEPGV